jgi:hypothetical protein
MVSGSDSFLAATSAVIPIISRRIKVSRFMVKLIQQIG